MSFPFEISPHLKRVLNKLGRKDKNLAIAVIKKIEQIVNSDTFAIEHFKNMRYNLSHLKRVHIGSFVLTFRFKEGTIIFEDFDHHDRIYNK